MSNNLQEELIDLVFSQKGLLGSFLKEFEERIGQKQMASQIVSSFEKEGVALIEAGTGIGKSLAYLVPAIYWALKFHEKVVISTHTIALQEQLIYKDIPFLLKTMNVDLKSVLVKGMGNYLCLRKLHELRHQPLLFSDVESRQVELIEQWSEKTACGSRSEIPFSILPSTWEKVFAESDSCNHIHCPQYKQCFFFKARQEAVDAQLLIVNHHLLLADLNSKMKEGFREEKAIIPPYNRLVIDEAHHLEQIALESFAASVDRVFLIRLLNRIFSETHPERSRLTLIRTDGKSLPLELQHKLDLAIPLQKKECIARVEEAFSSLVFFMQTIFHENTNRSRDWKKRITQDILEHPAWEESLKTPFNQLISQLRSLSQSLSGLEGDLETFKGSSIYEKMHIHALEIRSLAVRLEEAAEIIDTFFNDKKLDKRVRWVEINPSTITLVDATLDISSLLREHLFAKLKTAVLCSATLTTNQTFSFTKERLGLTSLKKAVTEKTYDSPFDYANRTLLVVPTDIVAPTDPLFIHQVIEAIHHAIKSSSGNAFVLFTSYDMLQTCYEKVSIQPGLEKYSFLKQGQLARHQLLEKFKKTNGSVLFATNSFWEGVDVPGEALRCVIIVKLPFQVPTEPVYQAYSESLEKEGKNPFVYYAIPQAVIKFKQGFGRLMRKKNDRGCIVCLDNRLVTKPYGKSFLNSLPPCRTSFVPLDKAWEEMRLFYRQTYEGVAKLHL